MPDRPVALFAAGGTGGHIWPAVAVARVLGRRVPPWECHFVSGDRPVEREVYAAAGLAPEVMRLPRPGGGRWRTWLAMPGALLWAWRLLGRVRPDVILSTGGYVAAPVAAAAWLRGIPAVLLEPNAVPGRTTRALMRRVSAVAIADAAAAARVRARRVEVTGNPLTWSPADLDRAAARARWGIAEETVCLLVTGGSQGARALNELVLGMLAAWQREPPPQPMALLWMAGTANVADIETRVNELRLARVAIHLRGHIAPFFEALAAADIVVSRAGAGSVAEIALAGLPSILLPLPIALDDHQRANARPLVEAGAAEIFDERRQGPAEFRVLVERLVADPARRARMAAAARALAIPDAAERVAGLMADLLTR